MERLAANMGGTIKWPYNNSECLDADFFKVVADHLVTTSGIRPLLHSYAVDVIMEDDTIKVNDIEINLGDNDDDVVGSDHGEQIWQKSSPGRQNH